MYKIKMISISALLIFLTGCAITTTYGVDPQQDIFDENLYAFTIFYNEYSNSYDIQKKLKEEIKKFMEVNSHYTSFEVVNYHCGGGITKCVYEVRFY